MGRNFVDYFMVLEVHLTASDEVIKAAYKKLCQIHHPDNDGSTTQLSRISEAYHTLIDPEKKRLYLEAYLSQIGCHQRFSEPVFQKSMYDYSIQPIRRVLLEYLFFIQSSAYEEAYALLSTYNKKHIFKKDFIEWQSLITRIHKLVEFDCTYKDSGVLDLVESKHLKGVKSVQFRVKVVEQNNLLGKSEEDFFNRVMVLETDGWKVLIKQKNIRGTIKKYKKIVDIYKRQHNPLMAEKSGKHFTYSTGFVTKQTFLNNCEHEQLRYTRYDTCFTIVYLKVDKSKDVSEIKRLLEKNTRVLDSITYMRRGYFLILLPETDEIKGKSVCAKLVKICEVHMKSSNVLEGRSRVQQYASIKELLNEVIK